MDHLRVEPGFDAALADSGDAETLAARLIKVQADRALPLRTQAAFDGGH